MLSFLPVGHTHEDIDQMFSRISVALNNVNTESVQDLCTKIPLAYTPAPVVEEAPVTANFRDWIQSHIVDIRGHSKPHTFKITAGDDGCVLQWKCWTRRKTWKPEQPIPITNVNRLMEDVPGEPEVTPFKEYDVDELERSIARLESYFIRDSTAAEWLVWIRGTRDLDAGGATVEVWRNFVASIRPGALPAVQEAKADPVELGSESETEMVWVGARRKRLPEEMEVVIEVGRMAAIRIEGSALPFEAGLVLAVDKEVVEVHWYGTQAKSGRGKWTALLKSGTNEAYTQRVLKENVIWAGFDLLFSTKRICKKVVDLILGRVEAIETTSETASEGEE